VGCAKGFMLFDLMEKIPGIKVRGIDISKYAIEHAKSEVKEFLDVGNANSLPYPNNSFDAVISINTIHNLEKEECGQALKEIERVSKGKSFITVDAYRTEAEKERMYKWNLTAKTIMSVDEWISFFDEVGYTGDFYWFIP
jgi:ubiquinone/menaquinone biosynthesis C-methylase UbiE